MEATCVARRFPPGAVEAEANPPVCTLGTRANVRDGTGVVAATSAGAATGVGAVICGGAGVWMTTGGVRNTGGAGMVTMGGDNLAMVRIVGLGIGIAGRLNGGGAISWTVAVRRGATIDSTVYPAAKTAMMRAQ